MNVTNEAKKETDNKDEPKGTLTPWDFIEKKQIQKAKEGMAIMSSVFL